MSALNRLASYGTLAPGQSNHDQVAHLKGRWFKGTVRGNRTTADWGQWTGYPGFVLDRTGNEVEVQIFESEELRAHWDRLDTFEGDAYRRVITTAHTERGSLDVSIYTLCAAPEST